MAAPRVPCALGSVPVGSEAVITFGCCGSFAVLLRPCERFARDSGGADLSVTAPRAAGPTFKELGVFTVAPTHGVLKLAGDTRLSID